jgi:hypothetical protein
MLATAARAGISIDQLITGLGGEDVGPHNHRPSGSARGLAENGRRRLAADSLRAEVRQLLGAVATFDLEAASEPLPAAAVLWLARE